MSHWDLARYGGRLSLGREGLVSDFDSALHPRIVKASDAVKDARPCLGQSQVKAAMDAFALDHAEEVLGGRVVGAVANLAHTAEDGVTSKEAVLWRFLGAPRLVRISLVWVLSNVWSEYQNNSNV